MSFGGFVDNTSRCGGGGDLGFNTMPAGVVSHPRLVAPLPSLLPTNPSIIFNTPALSLALQTCAVAEGRAGEGMASEAFNQAVSAAAGGGALPAASATTATSGARRSREELEQELNTSRSGGSDNFLDGGAASGDDLAASDENPRPRKKRYHRHTPHQIQELEALFSECPHPDEKQRLELSRRLSLKTRQVKFWFQNRRTQMKTQIERHENSVLRQENDKLRSENQSLRDAMRNPMCTSCGGPAIIGDISLEQQHLRIENARLKDDLDRVVALAGKFIGSPISPLASTAAATIPVPQTSALELGFSGFVDGLSGGAAVPLTSGSDFGGAGGAKMNGGGMEGYCSERSMMVEHGLAAMRELLKMAQGKEPLWVRTGWEDGEREVLNREEYMRSVFTPPTDTGGFKFTAGFATEASRETGVVIINSLALVETLMDSNRWAEMFPCMIGKTSTTDVICSGLGRTRNGAIQLMRAELQVLSPLVPVREVSFLRFCKQQEEGVWAVVDVSVDSVQQTSGAGGGTPAAAPYLSCRRLPSGCLVQDMPNGYSKVTWVEHAEYDENVIHPLYQPVIAAGMGFGARRWVANLQRQCQCLAILMSSTLPIPDHTVATILPGGRRSMLKLAQRMTDNFCGGVCAWGEHKWRRLCGGAAGGEEVRVMSRASVDDPGEPPGVVLSAATSVWLPLHPARLFDFLRDERLRSQWDILSNGGPMQEMAHIAKGQHHGNCVSLLRAAAMSPGQSSMLILQETCTDASGSLVVYAPVDSSAMHVVMSGGDSAYVALLPSGFAVVPDGRGTEAEGAGPRREGGGGSLLTVAFQILVNSLPTAKLTVESVETVNNLISCTLHKIRAALPGDH